MGETVTNPNITQNCNSSQWDPTGVNDTAKVSEIIIKPGSSDFLQKRRSSHSLKLIRASLRRKMSLKRICVQRPVIKRYMAHRWD